jgi:uncharacterized protein (TIGR02271 family)
MDKRIVGTFNSEQEVMCVIEGLKRQGHRETDMMVVAGNRSDIPLITSHTGVMVEADMQESTLAGVMMDSFINMMAAGMGVRQENALSSRLIERGLPEFTAKQCEQEIKKGKIILVVDTNGTTYESHETVKPRAGRLREEPLDSSKERVKVGELQLHKEVVEEKRTIHVPLIREEVYVEHRPVIDGKYDGSQFKEDEIIRIPISEERIEVTKRPVVVEEVIVGKRGIQEIKQVQDVIKKEEARIERSVPSEKPVNQMTNAGQEEVITEGSDISAVKENSNIATLVSEDKKGKLDVQREKNKPESSASKDSPVMKENESESYVSAVKKEEAINRNENSSKVEGNKTNKKKEKKKNEQSPVNKIG